MIGKPLGLQKQLVYLWENTTPAFLVFSIFPFWALKLMNFDFTRLLSKDSLSI